jgi:hypothetical protein
MFDPNILHRLGEAFMTSLHLTKTDKLKFLGDALEESFRNIRQYQEISYQVTALGTGIGTAFIAWLVESTSDWEKVEKIGLEVAALAFTLTILIILNRCGQLLTYAYHIVNQINTIYGCYDEDFYMPNQTLFPATWRNLGPNGRSPLIGSLMLPSVILFVLASALIVYK